MYHVSFETTPGSIIGFSQAESIHFEDGKVVIKVGTGEYTYNTAAICPVTVDLVHDLSIKRENLAVQPLSATVKTLDKATATEVLVTDKKPVPADFIPKSPDSDSSQQSSATS